MVGKTVFLMLVAAAWAQAASPQASPLDTAGIRKTYMDGDFDQAIEDIERALKRGGPFSHQDSVFMFKHLGVMHAAKYETREKGRYYMFQLLTVEPAAKILDMYASDMIYMIFKNIQIEFEANRGRLLVDHGDSIPKPRPVSEPKAAAKRKSRAWIGWTAGAMATVGGVVLALHLMEEPQVKENIAE